MKKKLVLLIALVLAFAYGQAGEVNYSLGDQNVETFSTYLGQQATKTLVITFQSGEIPIDPPYPPVVDQSTGSDESSEAFRAASFISGYTATIVGLNSEMFSARVSNTVITMDLVKVTIEVTYTPTTEGTHEAILILNDNGSPRATRNLKGTATELIGDVNGDGLVNIEDVSMVIETLLGNNEVPTADVDGDGLVTVADISSIIDILLGVPVTRPRTFLIIDKTDGNIVEYMINENTKVKIAKPDLVIEMNGQLLTYPLAEVSQLRYDERMETINSKITSKKLTQADRETLKALMP